MAGTWWERVASEAADAGPGRVPPAPATRGVSFKCDMEVRRRSLEKGAAGIRGAPSETRPFPCPPPAYPMDSIYHGFMVPKSSERGADQKEPNDGQGIGGLGLERRTDGASNHTGRVSKGTCPHRRSQAARRENG